VKSHSTSVYHISWTVECSWLNAFSQKKESLAITRDTHNVEKSTDQSHLLNIWTIIAMDRTQAKTHQTKIFAQYFSTVLSRAKILCKISPDIAGYPNRSQLFFWLSVQIFQASLQVCSRYLSQPRYDIKHLICPVLLGSSIVCLLLYIISSVVHQNSYLTDKVCRN
jgi:hypothetical protein